MGLLRPTWPQHGAVLLAAATAAATALATLAAAAAAAISIATLAAVALTTAAARARADLASGARSARRGLGTRSVCAGGAGPAQPPLEPRAGADAARAVEGEGTKCETCGARRLTGESRGKMKGGSARAVRHDDNESAPPIALVVTSVSKKDVEIELDAPVGLEAGAP